MITRQLVMGLVAAALAVAGHAQQPNVDQRLEQLEQEIRILKRQRELDQEAAVQKVQEAAKTSPVVTAGKDGFSLKSADGNFVLKLKGVVQADSRWYLDDQAKNGTDTFLIRRARPILEGTLFKDFDFRLMPDFGNNQVVLFDAYVEWKHWPELKLKVGKFKSPYGLEQTQEDLYTTFTERSLVTDLVPNRDVGVQLGGELLSSVVSYAVGVFNGVPDGANGDNDNGDSKDFEGRLFIQPFLKTDGAPLQGFGAGIAGTIGNQDGSLSNPNLPTFKTTGQNTFFRYLVGTAATNSVIANGQRTRYSPQGYYYWGPLGIIGEYAVTEQQVQKGPASDHLRNRAWEVTGSWVLTGERASFKGVTPRRPFDLATGSWGAFQLVVRYSELRVDPDTFPLYANPGTAAQEARDWGIGINWYLNPNIKVALDYDHTVFDGGAAGGKNRQSEEVLFTRVQLAF
ncbi:MAG: porin [Verrucomicrobiota bacterium]